MVTDNILSTTIPIEVAYASARQSWLIPFAAKEGSTVREAIVSSGILEKCCDINLQTNKVGIFSKIITLDAQVMAGDRIEIYRPLLLDPKEARRLRAEKTKQEK